MYKVEFQAPYQPQRRLSCFLISVRSMDVSSGVDALFAHNPGVSIPILVSDIKVTNPFKYFGMHSLLVRSVTLSRRSTRITQFRSR